MSSLGFYTEKARQKGRNLNNLEEAPMPMTKEITKRP
jgi:hypothetical protein